MAAVNEAQVPSIAVFEHILCVNKDRLESLCQAWEGKLEANPPKAVDGQIRYVIGMARILTGPKGRFFFLVCNFIESQSRDDKNVN
jgi:hypothetical protein